MRDRARFTFSGRRRIARTQRSHQRRLALVEADRMVRIVELEQRVIQVMPKLMHESAQKGARLDYIVALRRAHPEDDQRGAHDRCCAARAAGRRGGTNERPRIEKPVQFAARVMRTDAANLDPYRADAEQAADFIEQRLRRALDDRRRAAIECAHQRGDHSERGRTRLQRETIDRVASQVAALGAQRQSIVIGGKFPHRRGRSRWLRYGGSGGR
jgi:hypothetical protein